MTTVPTDLRLSLSKMAALLTAEQELAVSSFLEIVNKIRKRSNASPVSRHTAQKFLTARKFDVTRAVSLYEQHEATRQREGLVNLDPLSDPLKSELETGKFTILPTRDSTGATIAVFTARIHSPQTSTHQTTLQGIVYQLDAALTDPDTQRYGLVFIYDMSESKYANFDYDLSQKILTMLKGGYPAKLKKVLIVTAPLWFKAPFKILRLFVREKLRDRVYTVSLPQLPLHIPRGSLPVQLGGTLEPGHHDTWLENCAKLMTRNCDLECEDVVSMDRVNGTTHIEIVSNPKQDGMMVAEVSESVLCGGNVSEEEEEEVVEITNKHSPKWNSNANATNRGGGSPMPPISSASSGFSDDDSLHCDTNCGFSLPQFIEIVRSKGRAGLIAEYEEIKSRSPDGTFQHAKARANTPKNRYSDVLCYDHSRVLLSQIDDDPNSDYINANFVDGYKQKNAFISTQGPLYKTSGDFWRMVWEQQSLVIVMTTRVKERMRVKCDQYWPEEQGMDVTYGNFLISNYNVESHADFIITSLLLSNTKTEEIRDVTHLQYTSWPDYGVPHSANAMLGFIARVRDCQSSMLGALGDTWAGHPRGPPIIVHCSAGIGRTGTFCTLDICISRLEDNGTVDVRGTVERIRSQRAHSIQMPDQYIFCHLALIEYALDKKLIVSPPDLTSFEFTRSDESE